MKRNLDAAEEVDWSCNLLDAALKGKEGKIHEESSPKALVQSLDRLSKRMKELKDLPLKVVNVQPLSARFAERTLSSETASARVRGWDRHGPER